MINGAIAQVAGAAKLPGTVQYPGRRYRWMTSVSAALTAAGAATLRRASRVICSGLTGFPMTCDQRKDCPQQGRRQRAILCRRLHQPHRRYEATSLTLRLRRE